ncbi:AAA family ATPase, partial [Citrobacter koseri]|uniref:AAA family ATPase n=1 Tax=Citrobacter koseri TaxID=545 RepID=UPI0013D2A9A3
QLAVSKLTATSLRIPPTVLHGPPGVGKTHFARRLASILGTSTKSITASSSHDLRGNFLGLNPFWRNARMGYIARTMING